MVEGWSGIRRCDTQESERQALTAFHARQSKGDSRQAWSEGEVMISVNLEAKMNLVRRKHGMRLDYAVISEVFERYK